MIAIDTETTGVDFYHGARPFFVSLCDGEDDPIFYEWDVDPFTRKPLIPICDLETLRCYIHNANGLVLHNAKFDITALASINDFGWPFDKTEDTLFMGHILHSNQPKDLTSMGIRWLGQDISKYENDLEVAVKEAQRIARRDYPYWRIAKEDQPDMPSAGEKKWKSDLWLPRAIAKQGQYSPKHPWWTILQEYANADTVVTSLLYLVLEAELKRRGYWNIYQNMRRRLTRVTFLMEKKGVTLHKGRLVEQTAAYTQKSKESLVKCTCIAASLGHKLVLPKNGMNNNLRTFCFDVMQLEHIINKKAKTSNPTLNKAAMDYYLQTLDRNGKPYQFLKTLAGKRKMDTAVSYMEGYTRYWLPFIGDRKTQNFLNDWFVLHPNLNITGTDTLRFSSNHPNEQNISKQEDECRECHGEGCPDCNSTGKQWGLLSLRRLFGPAPGREWWSLDAKNIELRIPAYEANERVMINLFEKPEEPPYYGSNHLVNFHAAYPDLWDLELNGLTKELGSRKKALEKVGPHCKKKFASTWYQYAKNGGFAIQYGAVLPNNPVQWGTADRAFHRLGCHAKIKERLAGLESLNRRCIEHANKYGYVETIPDKDVDPRHGYPLLCTRTEYGKILETVPLSYHVQGTAMWWMCMAMIRCQEQLDEWNKSVGKDLYFLVMQVHDELVFDFPAGVGPEPWKTNLPKIRKIQQLMARGGEGIGVPTPVSVEYHVVSWAEGKTL